MFNPDLGAHQEATQIPNACLQLLRVSVAGDDKPLLSPLPISHVCQDHVSIAGFTEGLLCARLPIFLMRTLRPTEGMGSLRRDPDLNQQAFLQCLCVEQQLALVFSAHNRHESCIAFFGDFL